MSNIESINEDIISFESSYKDKNTTTETVNDYKTGKSKTIIHTPPAPVIEKMDAMRIFFKRNDMPFVVFPIAHKSICVRNNKEVNDPNQRILYKSIIETLNIFRKGNKVYDPNALCYDFREDYIPHISVDFDPNKIKENYNKYEKICKGGNVSYDFKPWDDTMIK